MLMVLVVTEFVLRTVAPLHFIAQIRSAREYDAELGVRKRANVHLFETSDFQEETIANSVGASNFYDDYSRYRYLVFAIGDSYTEGAGVPADCSFPFQLDVLLNLDNQGRYRRDYAVVNLGLGGYGTQQEITTLRRYANITGVPDVVLLMGCDNDFRDDAAHARGYKHLGFIRGNPNRSRFLIGWAEFIDDLELVKRVFLLRTKAVRRRLDHEADVPERTCTAERQVDQLERLRMICAEMGSELVVSWVAKGSSNESYQWLEQWAADRHVEFADYLPAVNAIKGSKPTLGVINQHATKHFRTWVNHVIAREYGRKILRLQPRFASLTD